MAFTSLATRSYCINPIMFNAHTYIQVIIIKINNNDYNIILMIISLRKKRI